jgi:hypothetical protein
VKWALNSNVSHEKPGDSNKLPINRQGLAALIKINGVEAYACWDSGSELNTITPDFIQTIGIMLTLKEESIKIRLGTKRNKSQTSYEVKPMLDFGLSVSKHDLDIINLDRWDLLHGSPFCNKYGVILNYKTCTICWGKTIIKALTHKEESAIRKGKRLL